MAGNKKSDKRRDRENRYRRAAVLHPLRQRILHLMADGREAELDEIADVLEQPPGRVAYHLSILVARGALKILPRRPPAPPLYRWASDTEWVRKMLDEIDARAAEDE